MSSNRLRNPDDYHESAGQIDQCMGGTPEWHLDFANTFQHISFGFVPRFLEQEVSLVASLLQSWFEPVGTIRDAVNNDGIE